MLDEEVIDWSLKSPKEFDIFQHSAIQGFVAVVGRVRRCGLDSGVGCRVPVRECAWLAPALA